MANVEVDKKLCIGCGICISLLPEVFEFDDDGLAKVKNSEGASFEKSKEVSEMCPTRAIKVSEK